MEPNTKGARWNPPGVATIYTSVERATAIAEARYRIMSQPNWRVKSHRLHRLRVALRAVLDLRDPGSLRTLGIDPASLDSIDLDISRRLGGAAVRMQHDGLIVPSVRHPGINVVVFIDGLAATAGTVEAIGYTEIDLQLPEPPE